MLFFTNPIETSRKWFFEEIRILTDGKEITDITVSAREGQYVKAKLIFIKWLKNKKFNLSSSTQSKVCFVQLLQGYWVNKNFVTAVSLKYGKTKVDCPQCSVKSRREKCSLYSF